MAFNKLIRTSVGADVSRAHRRFIGPNRHQPKMPHSVTLSRSEGSVALGVEMLRCAQHDSAILLLRHRHLRAFRLPSPQGMVIGNFLG